MSKYIAGKGAGFCDMFTEDEVVESEGRENASGSSVAGESGADLRAARMDWRRSTSLRLSLLGRGAYGPGVVWVE